MSFNASRLTAPDLTGPDARCSPPSWWPRPDHRGCAGPAKTEILSQRVADLVAEGVPADSIVAFTFTERAADELKNRISHQGRGPAERAPIDQLTGLFVGTIHAYCFRLLQQRVPRYETYDVLDENQLTAFLSRARPPPPDSTARCWQPALRFDSFLSQKRRCDRKRAA